MMISFAASRSFLIVLPDGREVLLRPSSKVMRADCVSALKGSTRLRLGQKRFALQAHSVHLHLDIRTPFGEDVTESQIATALQEALGAHQTLYSLRGWHVMHVEDTHVGHLHRLLVTLHPMDSARESHTPGFDYRLPLELALIGLGEKIGDAFPDKTWQLLFKYNDRGYSVLLRGDQALHSKSLPWDSAAAMDLYRHQALLGGQEIGGPLAAKVAWPLDAWNEGETAKGSPLDHYVPGMGKGTDSDAKALALGLAHVFTRQDILSHDKVLPEEKLNLRQNRLILGGAWSMAMLVLGLALGGLALVWNLHAAEKAKSRLAAEASRHQEQVQALASLRGKLALQADSLALLGALDRNAFPVSLVLTGLAKASSPGGILGFQMRPNPDGGLEMRLRAWTPAWEDVEKFRSALAAMPEVATVEITEQQKENGKGKILFDLTMRWGKP